MNCRRDWLRLFNIDNFGLFCLYLLFILNFRPVFHFFYAFLFLNTFDFRRFIFINSHMRFGVNSWCECDIVAKKGLYCDVERPLLQHLRPECLTVGLFLCAFSLAI